MTPHPIRQAAAALILLAAGLCALPCRADDLPMATGSAHQPTPEPSSAVAVISQPPRDRADTRDEDSGDPRRPRGTIEVGVGTSGYRHVSGVVTAPVGNTGQITVAVDKTEGQTRWR